MSSFTPSAGHAALRKGRRSLPGQTYLVTTATHGRKPWFQHWLFARAVAVLLGDAHIWRCHQVHAWVLMPDHLHVLLTLGEEEDVSRCMGRVKAVTARAARVAGSMPLPFWQQGFHDHALRNGEQVHVAARYVVDNPVRAGLVASPWQWPFWDCQWWEDLEL